MKLGYCYHSKDYLSIEVDAECASVLIDTFKESAKEALQENRLEDASKSLDAAVRLEKLTHEVMLEDVLK